MAATPQVADDEEGPAQVSRPVVEPTAPSAGKALNVALGHLARDPRNVDALVEAGNAALALGDNEAALGFFTRADQVSPANAMVKVAIAGARLHLDDPVEALRWYAEAERAGGDPSAFALDRGLAYDLVGDNTASIAQYRLVLARNRDPVARDEATRREAVSLAIGADRRSADLALLPLLQRQDRAAWRAHIFVLAIAGRGEEAVSVAHATMPPELADQIAPYLRFMVRLTPAQQAAVASLGRFPRAADIGRDDPRVMAYAATHPHVPLVVAAPPVLAKAAPTAAELKAARKRHGPTEVAAAPKPAALPDVVLPAPPAPVLMATNTGPVPAPSAGHPPVVVARIAPVAPAASRTTSRGSGFDLAQSGGSARSSGSTALSPKVPQPTVLSKLDMPPPHRTAAVPVAAVPTPPISTTYYGSQPHTVVTLRAPVAGPAMVSSPVVEATPHGTEELPPLPVAASTPIAAPLPAAPTPVAPTPAPTQVAVASSAARFEPPIPEPSASAPVAGPASGPAAAPTSGNLAIVATPPVPGATESVAPAPKPVPALAEPPVAATHPVVEAVPAPVPVAPPPHAKPVLERAIPEKTLREKAAAAQLARDEAKSAKDAKGRTKAGKDKAAPADDAADMDKPAKGKASAKDKLAAKDKKGKAAAKDADAEPALEPCKPAPTAKGRKGKAATKSESAHASKAAHGTSRNGKLHEGKAKKHTDEDNETCAPVTKGDRPDGPAGVSRDSDNDDSHATRGKDAQGKEKAKGKHGKDLDAEKSEKSDKPEKGGRKAHYASRIWVQVLTGGDRDKMAGEWRAMVRKAHGLKARKPYLTPWHSNFRLLTGPFDSDAEAQDFIAELRKDGVSGFEWTSPAGQAVDSLGN